MYLAENLGPSPSEQRTGFVILLYYSTVQGTCSYGIQGFLEAGACVCINYILGTVPGRL